MSTNKYFRLAIFVLLSYQPLSGAQTIDLIDVPVVLPDLNSPFLQREAKITTGEYPLAQTLRPYLEQGKYDTALTLLGEHQASKSPALLLLEAQLLMQASHWQQAEQSLLKALKEMPQLLRAHMALATLHQAQQQPEKARNSLSKAISLGATDASHFAQLGYLNMQNDDPHSAVAAYQQALMLDVENGDIRQGLLFALVNSSQFVAARNLLESMLQKKPNNNQLWLQRANLAMQSGDDDIALSSVEVAIRLGGTSKQANMMAMQLNLKQKNYPRALELCISLMAKQQITFMEIDKLLNWLSQKNEWQHVESLLAGTVPMAKLASFEHKSSLWHYRGQLAMARNAAQDAEKAWKKSIELNPGNGDALLALAKISTAHKRYAQADIYYQRAQRLPHVSVSAKLGRAQMYIDQLDYVAALPLIQDVYFENPHRKDLQKNIQTLTSLVNNQQHF